MIISVFCNSCEPICEPEITPVFWESTEIKTKQFHVQCSVHKSYKTRKWTSSCIGNFEENMDLSRIYLAVPKYCTHFFVNLNFSCFSTMNTKLNIGKFKLPGEDKTLVHFLENQQTQKYLLLSSHIYNKSSVPRIDRNNSVSVLEKRAVQ